MKATATLKFGRQGARKVRYVADLVRGKNVDKALAQLRFSKRDAARDLEKLVRAAVANAEQTGGADIDNLFISELQVDEGPVSKRWRPRAHGRATRLRKRSSHITVVVSDER
jgi:large subunit ribosomal protein L22